MGVLRRTTTSLAAAITALTTLSACGDGQQLNLMERLNLQGRNDGEADAGTMAAGTVEEDVEAPEVFSVTEQGLWDGRPSLGGIWVAHPDVTDPERVLIRNAANGRTVVGALFRRETELPGPPLQVSSDAAAELQMVAGAPQELSVVALRRREVPAEPPEPELEEDAPEPVEASAEVIETTLSPAEIARTTTDAADRAQTEPADAG